MGEGAEVLVLDEVARTFPAAPPVEALRAVDLTVRTGEMVGVVGPSGSGKSTLLNVMGTLDRPTRGEVRIGGTPVSGMGDADLAALRAERIGFVFQHFHLIPYLSAWRNVALGAQYQGMPRRSRREVACGALERVGVAHRADHRPDQLSGGEQQRVAIARALMGDPAMVFADEPTGNLDSETSDTIMQTLRGLHAEGVTLVMITHDTELAASLPRQVAMQDGRIVADTTGGYGA